MGNINRIETKNIIGRNFKEYKINWKRRRENLGFRKRLKCFNWKGRKESVLLASIVKFTFCIVTVYRDLCLPHCRDAFVTAY